MTETTESSYVSQKGPSDHFVKEGPKFMSTPPKLCIHNILDPLKNVLDCKNGHLKNIKPGQFNGKDLPNWLELGRIGATAAIPLMRVSVCVCAHGYLCVCVCEGGAGEGVGEVAHLPHHCNPFQRTLPCSNPVYLLYLQYNASVSISNFETQVSIRRRGAHACAGAQPGASTR